MSSYPALTEPRSAKPPCWWSAPANSLRCGAPGEVLLVGHEPNLSELISLLVSGDARLSITMKKGGLCKVSAEILAARRCASLEWLLTPKQMGLMAVAE